MIQHCPPWVSLRRGIVTFASSSGAEDLIDLCICSLSGVFHRGERVLPFPAASEVKQAVHRSSLPLIFCGYLHILLYRRTQVRVSSQRRRPHLGLTLVNSGYQASLWTGVMVGRDYLTPHVGFVDFTPLPVYSPITVPRRLFQVSLGHPVTTRLNKLTRLIRNKK